MLTLVVAEVVETSAVEPVEMRLVGLMEVVETNADVLIDLVEVVVDPSAVVQMKKYLVELVEVVELGSIECFGLLPFGFALAVGWVGFDVEVVN